MTTPYDPQRPPDLEAMFLHGPDRQEACGYAGLADQYQMLAEAGHLAARLGADLATLKPWMLTLSDAYAQLAGAAGYDGNPIVADVPELRRLLSEGYRSMAEVVADPGRPLAAVLDAGQLELLLAALDDAATWRGYRATSTCADCAESPAELCQAHADDLDQIDRYGGLYRAFEAVDVPAAFGLTSGQIR